MIVCPRAAVEAIAGVYATGRIPISVAIDSAFEAVAVDGFPIAVMVASVAVAMGGLPIAVAIEPRS